MLDNPSKEQEAWFKFNQKFPIFKYTVAASENNTVMQWEGNDSKLIPIHPELTVQHSSKEFIQFTNQYTKADIQSILKTAAQNQSRFNTDKVLSTFCSVNFEDAVKELWETGQFTKKQHDRLYELKKQNPMRLHVLYKSTNVNTLRTLAQLIRSGNLLDKEFLKIFRKAEFPYLILSLMDTPYGTGITYSQCFTLLELHQSQQPIQLYTTQARQDFVQEDRLLYGILDENGKFTEAANTYLLPTLRRYWQIDSIGPNESTAFYTLLRARLLLLPRSEQVFYRIQRYGPASSLSRLIYYEENHTTEQGSTHYRFIELSCGVRNAIGLLMWGENYAPVIPQLGPITMDRIAHSNENNYRCGQLCILSKQNGYIPNPNQTHLSPVLTPYKLFKIDEYYSKILSSIPSNIRQALMKMVRVAKNKMNLSSPWTKQTWTWARIEYFAPFHFKLNLIKPNMAFHIANSTQRFCALLDSPLLHGDDPYQGGILKTINSRVLKEFLFFSICMNMKKSGLSWA